MKKILSLIILLNLSCSSKAQVFNIYNNPNYGDITNAYYKDIDNFQNQFIGTWIYQRGLSRLEIKFRKKEMILINPGSNQFYVDRLIGEYKYIDVNGVEKVNSLTNLNVEHTSVFDYSITSGPKIGNSNYPVCNECPAGTERLYMFFDEPANDDFGLSAAFVIRHVIENGVEKLKAKLIYISKATNENKTDTDSPSTFREFSLPYGDYTLIKQ